MTETPVLEKRVEISPNDMNAQFKPYASHFQDAISGVNSGIKSALYTPCLYNWFKELKSNSLPDDDSIVKSPLKSLSHGITQIALSTGAIFGLYELAKYNNLNDSKFLGILVSTSILTTAAGYFATRYHDSVANVKTN